MAARSPSPDRALRTPLAPASAMVVLALALLILAPPAFAGPTPRTSLADVEREVMCPTCGTPLIVSDSPLAARERAFIQAGIARGETKAQIERDMVAQFGPGILATPPGHGFGLSAYLVPVVAGGLALVLLLLALVRWRHPGRPALPADPAIPADVGQRLDEDLAHYDL